MPTSSVHLFLNNFSTTLRHYRERAQLSQTELAGHISISLRTYQRIESGEAEPSLSQVYKLAQVLNFQVEEIFHFEQKMTEEVKILWQASNELQQLSALTKTGAWNFNVLNQTLHWSDVVKDIVEVPSDFKPDLDKANNFFINDIHREKAMKALDDCAKFSKAFHFEAEMLTAKGNSRHVTITGIPEMLEGKVIRIYGVLQNNTQFKLMNLELEKAIGETTDIQTFGGFGYWKLNLKKNELYWSKSLYDLFEMDPEKFGASYEAFLSLIHPDDRRMVDDAYKESLSTKLPYEVEHRLLFSDGRIKWVLEKCTTEFDDTGVPVRSFGYTLDITRYKATSSLVE